MEKNQATIKSRSSLEAFWDKTNPDGQGRLRVGTSVFLKLYPTGVADDRIYFTGNAIVTGIARQASFDGLIESSFTFQGTEQLEQRRHGQQAQPQQPEEQ